MKIYSVVLTSCPECNTQAERVFLYPPTEEEIDAVRVDAGGMYCFDTKVYEIDTDD